MFVFSVSFLLSETGIPSGAVSSSSLHPHCQGHCLPAGGPTKDIPFRVTLTLENSLKSLLTLERAPLWSMGPKDLERPGWPHPSWGKWACGVVLVHRGPADHGGVAVCRSYRLSHCASREQRQEDARLVPGKGVVQGCGTGEIHPGGRGEARSGGRRLLQEVASLQGLVLISHQIWKQPASLLYIQPLQKETKTTAFRIHPLELFHLSEKLKLFLTCQVEMVRTGQSLQTQTEVKPLSYRPLA